MARTQSLCESVSGATPESYSLSVDDSGTQPCLLTPSVLWNCFHFDLYDGGSGHRALTAIHSLWDSLLQGVSRAEGLCVTVAN